MCNELFHHLPDKTHIWRHTISARLIIIIIIIPGQCRNEILALTKRLKAAATNSQVLTLEKYRNQLLKKFLNYM